MSASHRFSVNLAVEPRAARKGRTSWLAGTALALLVPSATLAGVTNGQVVQGAATVDTSNQNLVTVNQTTAKAVINWDTFSNNAGQTVQFTQPDASSITLNRVVSTNNPSLINGAINATGQVWLLNPYGVAIGPTGTVNVRGFIGTTHNITDTNFMNSNYSFSDAASGGYGSYAEVLNEGLITVGSGYAILAGREVRNGNNTPAGGIFADLGSVVLAGVPTFALALDGDKLITFAVGGGFSERSDNNPLVNNIGNIQARGGRVLMSARATSSIVDSVVNMGGNINAVTARVVGGVIDLTAPSGTDTSGAVTLDGGANGVVRINGSQTDPNNGNAVIGGVINVNSNINAAPGSITVLGDEIVIGATARAKLVASATAGALSTGALANGGKISIGKGLAGTDFAAAPLANRIEIGNVEASNFDSNNQAIVEIQARAFGGTGRQGGQVFLATAPGTVGSEPTIETSGFIDVQASSNSSNMGGANGVGGTVEVVTPYFRLNPSGTIIANSVTTSANGGGGGSGGTVRIAAERIETVGDHTFIPNENPALVVDKRADTRISASGNVQGGNIFIGAGLGGTPAVAGAPLAREIWIGRDTSLRASAADLSPGSTGGNIVVGTVASLMEGDQGATPAIYIDGGISARGGNGGRLETVGHRLQVTGASDVADINSVLSGIDLGGYASGGANGTWLGAGRNMIIAASATPSLPLWAGGGSSDFLIDGRVLAGALNSNVNVGNGPQYGATNVVLSEALGGGGGEVLGLLVDGALEIGGFRDSTLELRSETGVEIGGDITADTMLPGKLNLVVKAGHNIYIDSSVGETRGAINTNGGALTLTVGGDPAGASPDGLDEIYNYNDIETRSGTILVESEYAGAGPGTAVSFVNDGDILSNGGNISFVGGNYHNFVNNGLIDASFDSVGSNISVTLGLEGELTLGQGSLMRTQGIGSITLAIGDGAYLRNQYGTVATEDGAINLTIGNGTPQSDIFSEISNLGTFETVSGPIQITLGFGASLSSGGDGGDFSTLAGDFLINAGPGADINLSGFNGIGGDLIVNADLGSFVDLGGTFTTNGGSVAITALDGDVTLNGLIDTGIGESGGGGGSVSVNVGGQGFLSTSGQIYSAGGGVMLLGNQGSVLNIGGSVLTGGGDFLASVGDGIDTGESIVGGDINLFAGVDTGGGRLDIDGGDRSTVNINGALLTQGGAFEAVLGSASEINVGYGFTGNIDAGLGDAIFAADAIALYDSSAPHAVAGDDIRFDADRIDLSGSAFAGNSIAIAPRTVDRAIFLGGTTSRSDGLSLTAFELENITAPTRVIGRADGAGAVDLDLTEQMSSLMSCDGPCPPPPQNTTIVQSGGAAGTVTVRGQGASDANETIRVIAGDRITLAAGLAYEVDASRVELVSNGSFVNEAGASALSTTNGGQWLIYSSAPAADSFGGLASGQTAIWGQSFTSLAAHGASALPGGSTTGNRYLFGQTPTVTVTAAPKSKTYGDTLNLNAPAMGSDYTVAGLVSAAQFGNVFLQDQLLGAPTLASTGAVANADVGSYTLTLGTGSLSAPTGYTLQLVNGALTVNRRLISASLAGAVSKIYDGTTGATVGGSAIQLSGLVNGDAITAAAASASYDTKNVGSGKLVTATGISLSGTKAGNYELSTGSLSGNVGTITAKAVQVSVTADNKVYDGSTAATGTVAINGIVAGDSVTTQGGTLSFADKNAGANKTVTATAIALGGADAGNYMLSGPAVGSASISAKQIGGSVLAGSKVYDGTTAAQGSIALTGLVAGDSVTASGALAFADKNVGQGKAVTASGIVLGGADAGNYALTAPAAGSANISAKQVTATVQANDKVYDGTAVAQGGVSLVGTIAGDSVSAASTTLDFADKNVGTAKSVTAAGITLSGGDAGNYVITGPAVGSASISAKPITATVQANDKVYDGTTAATGQLALQGVIAGDDVAAGGGALAFADKNAGSGKTVAAADAALNGTDAANYVLTGPVVGTAAITPRTLAAALTGSIQKVYDSTTAAALNTVNYALTGFVQGEGASIGAGSGSFASPNVGTGIAVTASLSPAAFTANAGTSLANYALPTTASGAIGTITPATLTYTANASTRPAATANPAFTGTVGGFVGNETAATATTGTLAFTSPADAASTPGSYAINGGGLSAANYVFVQAAGNATALTVTAASTQPAPIPPAQMQPVQQVTNTVVQQATNSVRTTPTPTPTPSSTPTNTSTNGGGSGGTGQAGQSGQSGQSTQGGQGGQGQTGGQSGGTSRTPPPPPPPPPPAPTATPTTTTGGGSGTGNTTPPPPPPGPPVEATPPSPVGDTAPPTPTDSADQGDPVLAEAEQPAEEQDEPTQEKRQLANTSVVAPGISTQLPTPPRSPEVPGADVAFSGTGNPAQW